jgi:hypothetical protein
MPANDATSETFFKITGANSTKFAINLKKKWPNFQYHKNMKSKK